MFSKMEPASLSRGPCLESRFLTVPFLRSPSYSAHWFSMTTPDSGGSASFSLQTLLLFRPFLCLSHSEMPTRGLCSKRKDPSTLSLLAFGSVLTYNEWGRSFFLPTFLGQFVTLGCVSPVFVYLFYALSPLKKYSTASARQIDWAGTLAVLPSLIVAFFLPLGISLFHHDLEVRHLANWYWQIFPITGCILLFALSNVIKPFVANRQIEAAQQRSKTSLKFLGGVMVTLSAASYWYMLLSSPLSVSEVFIPRYFIELPEDSLTATFTLLQYDYILTSAAVLLWLVYSFGDLKNAGICQLSWVRILLSSIAIGCTGGPGVLIVVGWLTRENMLARVEHAKMG